MFVCGSISVKMGTREHSNMLVMCGPLTMPSVPLGSSSRQTWSCVFVALEAREREFLKRQKKNS